MREGQRERVQHAGRNGEGQSGDDRTLRASAVRLAGREARDERGDEPRARDQADHEPTHAEAVMDVQRQHRHRDPDGQESSEHNADDRREGKHDSSR